MLPPEEEFVGKREEQREDDVEDGDVDALDLYDHDQAHLLQVLLSKHCQRDQMRCWLLSMWIFFFWFKVFLTLGFVAFFHSISHISPGDLLSWSFHFFVPFLSCCCIFPPMLSGLWMQRTKNVGHQRYMGHQTNDYHQHRDYFKSKLCSSLPPKRNIIDTLVTMLIIIIFLLIWVRLLPFNGLVIRFYVWAENRNAGET